MDDALVSRKRKRGQVGKILTTQPRSASPSSSDYSASIAEDNDDGTDTPLTPITPRSPAASASKKRPLKHFCDFPGCTKAFARPVRLEEHKRSHTNDRIFKCPEEDCDKDFLRDSHLKIHIKNAHTEVRDYICDWEGCDKAYSTGTRLRRHREGHEKPKKTKFRCTGFPPCNEAFRRDGNLQKHINSVHLQLGPLRCPHVDAQTGFSCQSGFDKASSLKRHEAEYHGETRFSCELCSPDFNARPTFTTYNELQAHKTQAHPPRCEHCGVTFSTNAQVRSHIDICHNEAPVDNSKKLPCPYEGCGKTFSKKGNLNVHVKTMHENQKPFTCGLIDVTASAGLEDWNGGNACGQSFTTKQSLAIHVRRHHLPDSKPKNVRKKEKKKAKVTALDKLTGNSRRISCIIPNCLFRFDHVCDLEEHAASHHGLDKDLIDAELAERSALNGGKFWIGGSDDDHEEEEDEDDFTGLGREATEIGGALGRALQNPRTQVEQCNDLEQDMQMAQMLSGFVNIKQEEAETADRIDPALLKSEIGQA